MNAAESTISWLTLAILCRYPRKLILSFSRAVLTPDDPDLTGYFDGGTGISEFGNSCLSYHVKNNAMEGSKERRGCQSVLVCQLRNFHSCSFTPFFKIHFRLTMVCRSLFAYSAIESSESAVASSDDIFLSVSKRACNDELLNTYKAMVCKRNRVSVLTRGTFCLVWAASPMTE